VSGYVVPWGPVRKWSSFLTQLYSTVSRCESVDRVLSRCCLFLEIPASENSISDSGLGRACVNVAGHEFVPLRSRAANRSCQSTLQPARCLHPPEGFPTQALRCSVFHASRAKTFPPPNMWFHEAEDAARVDRTTDLSCCQTPLTGHDIAHTS